MMTKKLLKISNGSILFGGKKYKHYMLLDIQNNIPCRLRQEITDDLIFVVQ